MIFIDDNGRAHLAYLVSFFADSAARRLADASVRDRRCQQRQGAQAVGQTCSNALIGTGPGGNAKTGQYEYGTDFGYNDVAQSGTTCTMNNANVKSVNLAGATSEAGKPAFSYTCPRNTFKAINGAYSPINDAHYFGNVVYNMYQAYMAAPPLSLPADDARCTTAPTHENAYWTGTAMTVRRRRQHVLSAGQPRRVRARGLARLHRAAIQPDLLRPVRRHERSLSRTSPAKPPSTS